MLETQWSLNSTARAMSLSSQYGRRCRCRASKRWWRHGSCIQFTWPRSSLMRTGNLFEDPECNAGVMHYDRGKLLADTERQRGEHQRQRHPFSIHVQCVFDAPSWFLVCVPLRNKSAVTVAAALVETFSYHMGATAP
jgi:hypothetical protein